MTSRVLFSVVGPQLEFHLLAQTVLNADEERLMREDLDEWSGSSSPTSSGSLTSPTKTASTACGSTTSPAVPNSSCSSTASIPTSKTRPRRTAQSSGPGWGEGVAPRVLAEVPTAWNQVAIKRVQHADRGRAPGGTRPLRHQPVLRGASRTAMRSSPRELGRHDPVRRPADSEQMRTDDYG